jgi:hypothetical protein
MPRSNLNGAYTQEGKPKIVKTTKFKHEFKIMIAKSV